MNDDNLTFNNGFDPESFDKKAYFESLLEAATNAGMLDRTKCDGIKQQCAELFLKIASDITGYENSSLPVKKSERIMNSLLYTVGFYLKTAGDPIQSIHLLNSENIYTLHNKGIELIYSKIKQLKELIKVINLKITPYNNQILKRTLKNEIPDILNNYSYYQFKEFSEETFSYCLFYESSELTGFEYIEDYVNRFCIELLFCAHFPTENINALIASKYYNDLHIAANLFQDVLFTALCGQICGSNPLDLQLSEVEFLKIELRNEKTDFIINKYREAAETLVKTLNIKNQKIIDYVMLATVDLSQDFISKIESESVSHYIDKDNQNKNKIIYYIKPRTSNLKYKKILDEFNKSCNIESKIDIFETEINSLADIYDLFNDAYLNRQEFTKLIKTMDVSDVLVLLKMEVENSKGAADLFNDVSTESNSDFRNYLKTYFFEYNEEQRKHFAEFLDKLIIIEKKQQI